MSGPSSLPGKKGGEGHLLTLARQTNSTHCTEQTRLLRKLMPCSGLYVVHNVEVAHWVLPPSCL